MPLYQDVYKRQALASAGQRVLCADDDTSVRSLDLLLETGEDILFNWYDAARGNCKKKDAVYDTLYLSLIHI